MDKTENWCSRHYSYWR